MNKEYKYTILFFLLSVSGFCLKYLFNIYLAEHLIPNVYGELSVALKILTILLSLVLLGTNVSGNRYLSHYLKRRKMLTAGNYIAWNIKLLMVTMMVTVVVGTLSLVFMFSLDYFGIRGINQYHLALYMLWIAPLAAINALIATFLMSSNHAFLSTFIEQPLCYLVSIVCFFIAVSLMGVPLTNLTIITILFFSYAILVLISILLTNRDIITMLIRALRKLKVTRIVQQDWLYTSFRLTGNKMLFLVINVIDLLIVDIIAKDPNCVGHYAAVLTIISVIWLIPNNLYQAIKPDLSSLLSSEDGKKILQARLNKINTVVLSLTGLLSFLIIDFSKALLSTFGPSYIAAVPALIVMTVATFVSASTNVTKLILIYSGFEAFLLKWNVFELVSLLILTPFATYYFDILGTAVSTTFVLFSRPLVHIYLVHKIVGIRPFSIV